MGGERINLPMEFEVKIEAMRLMGPSSTFSCSIKETQRLLEAREMAHIRIALRNAATQQGGEG